MPRSKQRRATYDEIVQLPEHLVGEIIDGELIVTPSDPPMRCPLQA